MRLDNYLAKKKNGLTRSKAQRAIRLGLVKVNKNTIIKPAYAVKVTDIIDISNKHLARMPEGYFKLLELQNTQNVIKKEDVVLCLASDTGGYFLAASELAAYVFGVCSNKKAELALRQIEKKKTNVRLMIGNLFNLWPSELTKGQSVDLIINDLAKEGEASIKAMRSVLNLLKLDGKILVTIKLRPGKPQVTPFLLKEWLKPLELQVIKTFNLKSEKNEQYALLEKI